ncbi:MAG: hypothetical protein JWM80_5614 [Cyanobacteria bacterium RYN_339]|nr:hypothetical protein [Cyanobacteria bacterium RYN_339]
MNALGGARERLWAFVRRWLGMRGGGRVPSAARDTAVQLAKDFAGYRHDVFDSSFREASSRRWLTRRLRMGNCADLAALAVSRFRSAGVVAHGVRGHLRWRDGAGHHFWVTYRDDDDGSWHFFDPTAATYHGPRGALDPRSSGWRYRDYGERYT